MRILVIEDEPDLQAMLAAALRRHGYAVDTAGDGKEGLHKAQVWNYDALVLDLMLPRMGGLELLHEFRRQRATPVLVLTARDSVQDCVQGLDAGADDYLVKPFEIKELLARLRAIVRRSTGIARAAIEIGDVAVDTAAQTVSKAGRRVVLTAREYALVEMLARHRGQLVSRTMIYDRLFDENDDTLSNLVEVHVSNVRKKLGREFISTRRGQGYVIDV